ncbi:MAG: GNAT family N-acetyltransferase [Ilumatobacteraceae bacterium]
MQQRWTVRPVRDDEFEAWTKLYRGYAQFYATPTSDEHQRLVWSWIHDERLVECIVAVPVDDDGNETGAPAGLAHLRAWVRPLRGVRAGYLDDLFVDPDQRGSGAVDALLDAIDAIAVERNWSIVRWTTGDENYRARAVYDRLATRTTWITYDMTPGRA